MNEIKQVNVNLKPMARIHIIIVLIIPDNNYNDN